MGEDILLSLWMITHGFLPLEVQSKYQKVKDKRNGSADREMQIEETEAHIYFCCRQVKDCRSLYPSMCFMNRYKYNVVSSGKIRWFGWSLVSSAKDWWNRSGCTSQAYNCFVLLYVTESTLQPLQNFVHPGQIMYKRWPQLQVFFYYAPDASSRSIKPDPANPLPAKEKSAEMRSLFSSQTVCLHVSRLSCVGVRHWATQEICVL